MAWVHPRNRDRTPAATKTHSESLLPLPGTQVRVQIAGNALSGVLIGTCMVGSVGMLVIDLENARTLIRLSALDYIEAL